MANDHRVVIAFKSGAVVEIKTNQSQAKEMVKDFKSYTDGSYTNEHLHYHSSKPSHLAALVKDISGVFMEVL